MATLIPTTQTTGVEAYEDMFKEITRKLYGEETGHGLHTLGTPMAHVATSGPTLPEGERSFTTLMADRTLTTIEYENNASETNNTFKTEDHITTAFGLAALMQNGFPPPGAISHNFQSSSSSASRNGNNSFMVNDERWPGNSEECLPWNANKNATYNCNQKTTSKHKNRDYSGGDGGGTGGDGATGGSSGGQKGQNSSVRSGNNPSGAAKRYNCQSCPYSTDRRDLFTRHENIHKDEKPFHCYACLKQFNRADHVKKHFLRMHRELNYDINKTRKTASSGSSSAAATNPPKAPTNYSINASTLNQQQQHISEFLGARTNATLAETTTNGGQQQNPPEIHQVTPQQNDTEQQEKMRLEHVHVEKKMKTEKLSNSGGSSSSSGGGNQGAKKKQGDKRYVCCYCPWTGADNWGLKRHLNTHTKPFVCIMCDYKAARSERLATHVFKVHNKKACNKCNFLADDQAQFITHQTEVHPHDARPARSGGGGGGSASSCTVLRSISNSFVQNTASQLTNNTNSTASGHAFCSLTHNSNVDNCGGAAGSGYNSNNNQNLSDLGIQQWRSTNRSSNSSTNQKKGAERLFQYMEADGSDPEDYSRQLRMAALSRNTASVAQDFHNAGGGDKMIVPPSLAIISSLMEQYMQQQQQESERWEESSGDGCEEAHHQVDSSLSASGDSSGANSNSPPAINHYQMMNKKHRRRSSCHDKENTNYTIPHKHCDKFDDKMWMKEIISNFYAHYNGGAGMKRSKLGGNGSIGQISQKLAQKNKEVQRHQVVVHVARGEESSSEKRHRKQPQPRKIPQADTTNVARIRDKHLTRLVSRQKSCQICVYKHKCVVMPFHSKSSLILHSLWRHSDPRFGCTTCSATFTKRYKLLLHQLIVHKRRTFKRLMRKN
ncbi:protein charlatan [Sergentomyia squamirostris]